MERVVGPARRAVHRDEIAERDAEEPDAGQAGDAHGEVVVIGIELDDDGLLERKAVTLAVGSIVRFTRSSTYGLEHCGFVLVQPQHRARVVGRAEFGAAGFAGCCETTKLSKLSMSRSVLTSGALKGSPR